VNWGTVTFILKNLVKTNVEWAAVVPFISQRDEQSKQMSKLITEKKLYLEPDVSLSSLSKLVGISSQKTSQVINQYANQNFNDFINFHRIQDAKNLLFDANNMKYTISSIAFDTGFSSLSSFNSAFKKFEGTTPSVYRKNNAK